MRKLAFIIIFLGLSFVSCESDINEEIGIYDENIFATGQDEVGDPLEEEDEEGS
ncbi:hypothetical protein [Aquimarina aggregata]|uniref:hypothetical protein n=1 Tax=Aquimarina aggregata TaxID=1642818 RepID=UPI00248F973D|nr:hypothetical protein [Aquimarina aggregata]